MPYRFAPGEIWTEAKVARALKAAWRSPRPLSPDAAFALTWPSLYLGGHPREMIAVLERSKAAAAGLSMSEWLREFGRKSSTHHRNWKSGCQHIAESLNAQPSPPLTDNAKGS